MRMLHPKTQVLALVILLANTIGEMRAFAQVTPIFTNSHPQPTLLNLVGTYYANTYLTNAVFSRNDGTINFSWGTGSPDPRIPADNFSVRWTGKVVTEFAGTYTFYTYTDDGVRLWVDNQLLIDSWVGQSPTEHTNNIYLDAGIAHDLVVEYFEATGGALAQVSWSGPYVTKQILGTALNPGGTAGNGDGFGQTLASTGGGHFAVGAPSFNSYNPNLSSTVYTDGRAWIGDSNGLVRVLNNSPQGFYLFIEQGFGASLSVGGNGGLLIGAPRYNGGSGFTGWITNMGALYFDEGGSPLTNPNGQANNFFGSAVAGLASNLFAVASAEGSGKVYLYGVPNGPIKISNPGNTSGFGSAIAALGVNRLLVANPSDSVAGDFAGSVYIYDLGGNLVRPAIHNSTGRNEGFGAALLAVDDHRFLVGVPGAMQVYTAGSQLATNTSAGVVYLYDDTGTRLLTFTNTDPANSGAFGSALAQLGTGRFLIGSPNDKIGTYANAGHVLMFTAGGLPLEIIQKSSPAAGDKFGTAVCALDDRRFVVGAPGDDTRVTDGGAIYGFDAPIPSAELGAEIPRPLNLNVGGTFPSQGPNVSPAGAAFWHVASQKLFAVKPGAILVSWPLLNGLVYNWQASIAWPSDNTRYQVHVAGQTPVDVAGSGAFNSTILEATTTDANAATVSNAHVFSAQSAGLSLLMLSSGDPATNAIRFQLVRTINWSDPSYLFDNAPAVIGQPIADPGPFHDPAAGSPQVILSNAVYCPAPVFDRATRTGTIIPVNQDNPANPNDDLVVAFYQRGNLLWDPVTSLTVSNNIFWAYKPVRYQPQWPTNAPHVVIASQQGTGVIDPNQYVNWQLYFQNDPNQPGYNPNDEHALVLPYSGGSAVFALRNDLGTPQTSRPFVLVRYQDPASGGQWRIKMWQVVSEEAPWFFRYAARAGVLLQPPLPLSALPPLPDTTGVSGPYWRDRKLSFWARAAGDNGGNADIVMHYFYPMQPGFFYPGTNPPALGSSIPWLDAQAGTPGTPIDVHFDTSWPDAAPELRMGETLVKPKSGLPDISSQTSVQIIYQQATALGQGTSVKLIDPTLEYHVPLTQLPTDATTLQAGTSYYFPTLPPSLQSRFYWDKNNHWLRFKGQFIQPPAGEYYLLLNVLTARDLSAIQSLSQDPAFQAAVNSLAALTANVTEVPPNATGFDSLALTAGQAQAPGYVTLAFGNNPNLSPQTEPISLAVIKVSCPPYKGQIEVIQSANPFDEKLTLRHSGDFAGQSDSYIFEWRTLPPVDGQPSTAPPDQWASFPMSPPTGQGALDITIQGPGLFTLSDNFFICRYRPSTTPAICASPTNTLGWSDWTTPMIAPGWISRVLGGINPFDQRTQAYTNSSQVNTIVSMISQAGKPYSGPVALNQQNANQFGLIETYETVLRRGEQLSIDGAPSVNYGPANDVLLRVAGQLSDLYMLLGNEAFADAADPTIAFGTDNQFFGPQATSIHCFMNQTASLMEEELDLLRGRDDTLPPGVQNFPVYNRLIWNFTKGIDGGEVAYALNYNIRAQDGTVPGTLSAADAAVLYPQGHGDAWGHYLSALKHYYHLLRNPNFTWVPTVDDVLVGGVTVAVGYEHERKFAAAAAARARAGAEIVNLTYRNAYVEDPSGQWQGYADSNTNRAWGLAEWGSRAGQGAYFDWVTANALLPAVDPDPTHAGIQKIDRTTVTEIRQILSALGDIQNKVDQADKGLNPLGLAKNAIPFDIDPNQIALGQTHFEQIYNRALTALNNAVAVFNRANNCTQLLRQQADSVSDFQKKVADQEADFNSRLVEIFGYPYAEDIGPSGTYPTGYSGPDVYHFDYVDDSALTGQTNPPTQTLQVTLTDVSIGTNLEPVYASRTIAYNISSQALGLIKPSGWTQRRAPGQIQLARSEFLQAYNRFQKALSDYNNLVAQIQDRATLVAIQYQVAADEIQILNQNEQTQEGLNKNIERAKSAQALWTQRAKDLVMVTDAVVEGLPKVLGLASDTMSPMRAVIKIQEAIAARAFEQNAVYEEQAQLGFEHDKEIASLQEQITLAANKDRADLTSDLQQLTELIRQESSSRLELFNSDEVLQQAIGRYSSAVASGERLLEDRLRFRQDTASQIQQYRYKDMAFRIFRNDALQKYRAQFDLAATYVYLAARAYDYETNLKPGDPRGPGSDFMTSIIRSRSLGIIQNGLPQTAPANGDAGLADPMARMNLNFQLVLKGQLGFNAPQAETGRFSLRSELFRVQSGSVGGKTWRDTLSRSVVDNLLTMPEFKRFCIPFQPQLAVEPAIVIPFSTTINFGQNFFGWPLGGGDNNYDSTHFATKIRSVGVWFANYNNLALASTPHVYLIPVGEDVMRSPSANVGDIRQWKIFDQALPVPFPLSGTSLNDPAWVPGNELPEQMENIRLYPEFRAYTDSGVFDPSQMISSYRLIGRSVWNTRWLLIIPAGELLSDRNEAIQRFINGSLVNGTRDGNGVTDIKIFFQTYAYAGN